MDGSKKKSGKKTHPHKSKILDNALLHDSSRAAHGNLFAHAAEVRKNAPLPQVSRPEVKREALQPVRKDKRPSIEHIGPDNGKRVKRAITPIDSEVAEKTDVFKIISDLEKQLDAAFSLKDVQEKEIQDLKEIRNAAEGRVRGLEAELEAAKAKLVAQRKLELELESFEHEQFEMLEEKRLLKAEISAGSANIKDLENKIAALAKGGETWDNRIAQMESEISNSNATIQNLRHQIFVLEDEKDVLSNKIEAMEAELTSATIERDRSKKELTQAKESLEEIRLTLVDTRTRARGRYYKTKPK